MTSGTCFLKIILTYCFFQNSVLQCVLCEPNPGFNRIVLQKKLSTLFCCIQHKLLADRAGLQHARG